MIISTNQHGHFRREGKIQLIMINRRLGSFKKYGAKRPLSCCYTGQFFTAICVAMLSRGIAKRVCKGCYTQQRFLQLAGINAIVFRAIFCNENIKLHLLQRYLCLNLQKQMLQGAIVVKMLAALQKVEQSTISGNRCEGKKVALHRTGMKCYTEQWVCNLLQKEMHRVTLAQ